MSGAPRRKLVEQAPTWRRAKRPDDMTAVIERMVANPEQDAATIERTVLHWIASAGDIHSAKLARLALRIDEYGDRLDGLL